MRLAFGSLAAIIIVVFVTARFAGESARPVAKPEDRGQSALPEVHTSESAPSPPEGMPVAAKADVRPVLNAQSVVVSFADGTEVTIRPRRTPIPSSGIRGSTDRLLDYYDELKRRAEAGNAAAAHRLYRDLLLCARAHRDKESLENAVARLHQERLLTFPNDVEPPAKLRADVNLFEIERHQLRAGYEFCKGVSDDQRSEAGTWLQKAADAGYFWALQARAVQLGFTPEAFPAWEELWEQGYTAALPPLSIFHQKGLHAADGQPDYLRAHAYRLVYYKVQEAVYASVPSSARNIRLLAMLEDNVRYGESFLTPQQAGDAAVLARDILASNSICCVGSW